MVTKFSGGLEPERAGFAKGERLHFIIENGQFSQHHFADGAFVFEPFFGVTSRKAESFGGAVVLVDDWSPPINHLLFNHYRAGCCCMYRDLERRQIVFVAVLLRQFQHSAEHGGHQLRMSHLIALYQR